MKTNTLDFDAQALREKILDLAMRGKLVPQDPNDEPASVLLEKIKAEKEQLIKDKKIKKSKPLAPITDDERPFDIPDSWEWVRLGDVNTYNSESVHPDRTPDKTFELYSVPIFPTRKPEIIKGEEIRSNKQAVETGDVLLCKINPRINRVWKVSNFTDNENIASTEWIVVRQREITTEYLRYSLMAPYFRNLLQSNVSGVGGSLTRAKPREVRNYVLPIPPLSEQSRIAAKIAQLFALLRKVESSTQQYAKLQTLMKSKVLDLAMRGKLVEQDPHDEPASVLLEKIKAEKEQLVKEGKIKKSKPLPPITDDEKPFDIPDNWEWGRLGDVTTLGNFYSINPQDIQYGENLIELADIESGTGKLIKQETVNGTVGSSKYRYFKGNVLFAKLRPYLRKVLLAPNTGVCTTELLPIDGIKIDNYFLYYSFLSDFFFKQIEKEMHGVNLPRVNPKKLSEIVIPIPPVLEQERICNEISHLLFLLHKSKKNNKRYFTNTKS